MCASCGCEKAEGATIVNLQTGRRTAMSDAFAPAGDDPGAAHDHVYDHAHGHSHSHAHGPHDHQHHHPHPHAGHDHSVALSLEARILEKNDALADQNRAWFAGREILALNLVSSPGAGKTTLLERTIRDLRAELSINVIEGDQATARDGERIRAAGAPAIQVNTGSGCHLEADMVTRAVRELRPAAGSLLLIENVGNLVCPAMFDLGEHAKVVILSVTEGEDKPLKYPHMFLAAELMIINKIDLLPHVDFDLALATGYARDVNPQIEMLSLSARSGEGLEGWYDWLRREWAGMKAAAFA
jgi:hydrogenase nickel incorporation protein HypB